MTRNEKDDLFNTGVRMGMFGCFYR